MNLHDLYGLNFILELAFNYKYYLKLNFLNFLMAKKHNIVVNHLRNIRTCKIPDLKILQLK